MGGSSLLTYVGLLGFGFVLGRIQLVLLMIQLYEEISALTTARKIMMAVALGVLVAIYVVGILLPLNRLANEEGKQTYTCRSASPTSFRRELRRRGSYSMSYVTDIKAHVFART